MLSLTRFAQSSNLQTKVNAITDLCLTDSELNHVEFFEIKQFQFTKKQSETVLVSPCLKNHTDGENTPNKN